MTVSGHPSAWIRLVEIDGIQCLLQIFGQCQMTLAACLIWERLNGRGDDQRVVPVCTVDIVVEGEVKDLTIGKILPNITVLMINSVANLRCTPFKLSGPK